MHATNNKIIPITGKQVLEAEPGDEFDAVVNLVECTNRLLEEAGIWPVDKTSVNQSLIVLESYLKNANARLKEVGETHHEEDTA